MSKSRKNSENLNIGVERERLLEILDELVEYLWDEEEKHWEESDKPRSGHVFLKLRKARQLLAKRRAYGEEVLMAHIKGEVSEGIGSGYFGVERVDFRGIWQEEEKLGEEVIWKFVEGLRRSGKGVEKAGKTANSDEKTV